MTSDKYWAIAHWDSTERQWWVRIEDWDDHHRGDTTAPTLGQVAVNASMVLATLIGFLVPVTVEAHLPDEIAGTVQGIERLIADAARQLDTVVGALRQAGMSGHDIAAFFAARPLSVTACQALLVPNTEIAARGLRGRPEVIAIEWTNDEDELCTYCRVCVDENREAWRGCVDGLSAAIYRGPVTCDCCQQTVAAPEPRPPRPIPESVIRVLGPPTPQNTAYIDFGGRPPLPPGTP